jgi:hypothetical protein
MSGTPQPTPDDILVQGYTTRYAAAAKKLLLIEGGFVDDPTDRGGTTKYGISLRFLAAAGAFDSDGDGIADFDLDMDGDIDGADVRKLTRGDAVFSTTAISGSRWVRCAADPARRGPVRPGREWRADRRAQAAAARAQQLPPSHPRLSRQGNAAQGRWQCRTGHDGRVARVATSNSVGIAGLVTAYRRRRASGTATSCPAIPNEALSQRLAGARGRARQMIGWAKIAASAATAAGLAVSAWLIQDRFHQKALADAAQRCAVAAAKENRSTIACRP